MNTDNQYFDHHQRLLSSLLEQCNMHFSESMKTSDRKTADQALLDTLTQLSTATYIDDDFQLRGQWLINQIISRYPQLTPLVHRDLFWFFGGDCLHFLSDEEMCRYQQIDELLYEAKQGIAAQDYSTARAKIFKLH